MEQELCFLESCNYILLLSEVILLLPNRLKQTGEFERSYWRELLEGPSCDRNLPKVRFPNHPLHIDLDAHT